MTDTVVGVLSTLTHALGGNLGWAIVALSFGVRVTLLPLTIRLSRRARRNQEIARALQPEIDKIKKRLEKQPELLFGEMQKLYREHGYKPFDLPVMIGSFVQLPIFGVLYGAIRQALVSGGPFLWIRSLVSPDALLTLLVLSLTATSVYFAPNLSGAAKSGAVALQVGITGLIIWKLSAGLCLYWLASSAVGLFQSMWLRHDARGNLAPA